MTRNAPNASFLTLFMKEHYELLYLLPSSQIASDLEPIFERVRQLLKEHQAEITSEKEFRQQRLAYPIRQIYHGLYRLLEFEGMKEHIRAIDEDLRHLSEILRHMIVKSRIKSEDELKRERIVREQLQKEYEEKKKFQEHHIVSEKKQPEKKTPHSEETKTAAPQQDAEKKPVKQEKVRLEDLDKKLDEILDDKLF